MEKTKILTERFIIRNYKEKDLNDLYEYLSDEEVMCFEPYTAMNLDDVKKNLNGEFLPMKLKLGIQGKIICKLFLFIAKPLQM